LAPRGEDSALDAQKWKRNREDVNKRADAEGKRCPAAKSEDTEESEKTRAQALWGSERAWTEREILSPGAMITTAPPAGEGRRNRPPASVVVVQARMTCAVAETKGGATAHAGSAKKEERLLAPPRKALAYSCEPLPHCLHSGLQVRHAGKEPRLSNRSQTSW